MADVVGTLLTGHSPLACFSPPSRWAEARSRRDLRADVPYESPDECRDKAIRIRNAFDALSGRLSELHPDALIVVGDDQLERYEFSNFPTISVHVGDSLHGTAAVPNGQLDYERRDYVAKGHPELASWILRSLISKHFDPAISLGEPGGSPIGHAFIPPLAAMSALEIPIVPIAINCYYAPQITGGRSYELGRAIRQAVEEWEADARVAVLGSGGLWHTPLMPQSYLDESFDSHILELVEKGRAEEMATFFDSYALPEGDRSQDISHRGRSTTGLPGSTGPQGGTREVCNWIVAAGTTDGRTARVVDYVPVYASPIGIGFAYTD